MKRFLLSTLSLVFFFGFAGAVFAQTAAPFKLHPYYETPINAFIKAMKTEAPEKAYALTGSEFKKLTSLADFKNLIELSQIKKTVSKKWTDRKQEPKKVTVNGVFGYSDGKEATTTFLLGHYGQGMKVDGWSLNLTSEMISDSFPQGEGLKAFLADEIKAFNKGIQDKRSQTAYYRRMGKAVQRNITLKNFSKALMDFKNEKRNAMLEQPEALTVSEGFPVLQGTQMVVEGSYPNSTHQVSFRFVYDYESGWKLNSFTVAPKTAEELKAVEEAAARDAAEKSAKAQAAKKALQEKRATRRQK